MENVIVTAAGLQALINAEQTGTDTVKLSKVIYSSTAITASTSSVLSDITDIVATLTSVSGTITSDHSIHISAGDSGTSSYTVKTIGIVTDNNVLFAVVSSDDGLLSKIATTQAYVSFDMELTQGNPEYITFGNTNFLNPDATTSVKGIAMIATPDEALAGESESKIITPATLKNAIFPNGSNYLYSALRDYVPGDMVYNDGKVYFCKAANGPSTVVVAPTNKSYWMLAIASDPWSTFPTGTVMPWVSINPVPDDWLIFNGQSLLKSSYTDLNAFINADGRLDDPNDSDYLILPDMDGRVLQGCSSYSDVLTAIEAGLPNIQGYNGSNSAGIVGYTPTGAMSGSYVSRSGYTYSLAADANGLIRDTRINASLYNSIYSDSVSTVQPLARYALMIVKA